MVELEVFGFAAAATCGIYIPTLPAITLVNRSPDRSRMSRDLGVVYLVQLVPENGNLFLAGPLGREKKVRSQRTTLNSR